MRNGTVSLGPMPSSENRTVSQVYREQEFYDTSQINGGSSGAGSYLPSTIGGLWLALTTAFNTTTPIHPNLNFYSLATSSPVSSQYLRMPNVSAVSTYDVSWEDPMEDMILMAHELMFRTTHTMSTQLPHTPAILGSENDKENLTSPQWDVRFPKISTIPRAIQEDASATATMSVSVYRVHHGWLARGFAVMCLACLAVFPTYWGWWHLGRPVSMSHLEIARAFDAPLLCKGDPNANGGDLKKAYGEQRVQLLPARGTGRTQARGEQGHPQPWVASQR